MCIYCHWLLCFVFETVREEVVYLPAFWHIWNLIAALVIVFGRCVSLFTCRFCTVVSCQAGRCIHQIVIMGISWDNVNNGSLLVKVLSGLKSFVVCLSTYSGGARHALSDNDCIMGIRVFWQSQRQSPHGPGQSPSGNFQSHQPHHFLNPALRVNNGMTLDMDTASQGFANRVRRVPNSIFPPSSTGNLEEDGLNNPGGKYSVPGGGGGHPPDRNGGSGFIMRQLYLKLTVLESRGGCGDRPRAFQFLRHGLLPPYFRPLVELLGKREA